MHLLALGNSFLLHESGAGSLHLVDPLFAVICEALRNGEAIEALPHEISAELGISTADAQQAIDKVALFLAEGQIGPTERRTRVKRLNGLDNGRLPALDPGCGRIGVHIAGQRIVISAARGLMRELARVLSHAVVPVRPGETPDVRVHRSQGVWRVQARATEVEPATSRGAALAHVLYAIAGEICARSRWHFALHAAALARKGQGIAIAGPSGAGKTTLAVGLGRRGFDLLSDDLVLFSGVPPRAIPVPLPLSIKEPSVAILSGDSPELLECQPIHVAGKVVRFMPPPKPPVCWRKPREIDLLVLPVRVPDGPSALREVSPEEALNRIVAANSTIGRRCIADGLPALVSWLNTVRSVELTYANLEQAAQHVHRLSA